MKRLLLLASAAVLIFSSCQKSAGPGDEEIAEESTAPENRQCASYEILQEQLKADPDFRKRFEEIEVFTQRVLANPNTYRLNGDVLEVPVHVNVLYRTSAENISNAQIQSQIDVLNEDFGATNNDYNLTPSIFQGVRSGNNKIKFIWNQVTDVNRQSTKKRSWQLNDDMKKSSRGGIDPTNCSTTLNIWVCNLSSGYLGYAQFPGGNCATDGVVIDNNAFGRGAGYSLYADYNKGRTATHEVGHYFNLRHIWGDATCGNDGVSDTPQHNTANYGCPSYPHLSTCSGTPVEMTMNYMDYTDDACMYMFTAGQASRMQASFATGGPRASLR